MLHAVTTRRLMAALSASEAERLLCKANGAEAHGTARSAHQSPHDHAAATLLNAPGGIAAFTPCPTHVWISAAGLWRGTSVAVSVVSMRLGPRSCQRVLGTERIVAVNLDHPNIVTTYVYDSVEPADVGGGGGGGGGGGRSSTRAYAVQELCNGGSLRNALQRGVLAPGTLRPRWPSVLRILCGVAAGMDYMHALRVFHGALMPANVLFKVLCFTVSDPHTCAPCIQRPAEHPALVCPDSSALQIALVVTSRHTRLLRHTCIATVRVRIKQHTRGLTQPPPPLAVPGGPVALDLCGAGVQHGRGQGVRVHRRAAQAPPRRRRRRLRRLLHRPRGPPVAAPLLRRRRLCLRRHHVGAHAGLPRVLPAVRCASACCVLCVAW